MNQQNESKNFFLFRQNGFGRIALRVRIFDHFEKKSSELISNIRQLTFKTSCINCMCVCMCNCVLD